MRNGRWIATEPISQVNPRSITRLIIGHDPAERFESAVHRRPIGAPVLSARNLCDEILKDVSFDLHPGEILGLAGLAGAGRSNVLEILFGLRRPRVGQVLLHGQPLRLRDPSDAVSHGIALVTEERKRNGYIPAFSIWQHVTLPWLGKFTRAGILRLSAERRSGEEAIKRFDIRTRSVDASMRELSGGNQQKAILARWLSQPLQVLLLDEPTHGVDVGAKEEIYRIVRGLAQGGLPQVIVSSDLDELEGLCDRVIVLVEGVAICEFEGKQINKATILDGYSDTGLRGSANEQ